VLRSALVGSLSGAENRENIRKVVGEFPDIATLCEHPQRGPGADMVGRTYGRLHALDETFSVTARAGQWVRSAGTNKELRQAHSWLREDIEITLEAIEQSDAAIKIAYCGPFTLASETHQNIGERLIGDAGAVRDLAHALAAVITEDISEWKRWQPARKVIVQVDEPWLFGVRHGSVPREGRGFLPPMSSVGIEQVFSEIAERLSSADEMWLHHCDTELALNEMMKTRFSTVSFPLRSIRARDRGAIEAWLDSRRRLALGVDLATQSEKRVVLQVIEFGQQLGIDESSLGEYFDITPECGLVSVEDPSDVMTKLVHVSETLNGVDRG